MPLHVKFSTGADGLPIGYPVEVREDPSEALLPGFGQLMTVEALEALKASMKSEVDAIVASRVAAGLAAARSAKIARLFDEPGERVLAKQLAVHENLIRKLVRALRASSTAANNQANTAGLPTAANSADLTQAQFLAVLEALDV